MTQQARQLGPVRVQHKVAVVAHQAVGQRRSVEAVHRLGNRRQRCMSIPVVNKDRFAPVASQSNVVNRTGAFDSQWAGHERRPGKRGQGKLRPDPVFPERRVHRTMHASPCDLMNGLRGPIGAAINPSMRLLPAAHCSSASRRRGHRSRLLDDRVRLHQQVDDIGLCAVMGT